MKVLVNGVLYNDITWNDNAFSFESTMTLAEAESAFTPGSNTNLIVYDGDVEIARYYNKGIESLTVGGNPRTITVRLNLTQITAEAEQEIKDSLDVSDGAIADLAEIVSTLSEVNVGEAIAKVTELEETVNTWFSSANDILSFINALRKEGGILDQFNGRIAALENSNVNEEA